MKKQTYLRNTEELENLADQPDDYFGAGLNAPKRSPMHRKAKFRTKEFITGKKQKERERNYRRKMKYDFEF
jgi:hypothetical protein